MLTQEQRKYLKDRLSNALYERRKRAEKSAAIAEPASITSARKIVKRHEAVQYEKQRKAVRAVDKEALKVRELLLFAEAEDALKAAKAFESK